MKRWALLFVVSFPTLAGVDVLSLKPGLAFEANRGQSPAEYKFVAVGPDHALLLSPTNATVRHPGGTVRIHWRGGKRRVVMDGLEPRTGKVNYLIGNRPSRWLAGIQTYSKVLYKGVYPGVDLVFHGTQGELEFDFVVAPGADPGVIRLSFEGASQMDIDASGDLVLKEPSCACAGRLFTRTVPVAGAPSRAATLRSEQEKRASVSRVTTGRNRL